MPENKKNETEYFWCVCFKWKPSYKTHYLYKTKTMLLTVE